MTVNEEVDAWLAGVEESRRAEVRAVHELISATVPQLRPTTAYHGMLGYGPYRYRYASGRTGESAAVTLAARKAGISLYVACVDEDGRYLAETWAERLPKASVGKSCIRFARLADLDADVVRELLVAAAERVPGEML